LTESFNDDIISLNQIQDRGDEAKIQVNMEEKLSEAGGKKMSNIEKLENIVKNVAEKYAALVEKRIDNTQELTGTDLHDIYEGIQMLGHIVATLERFSRMKCDTDSTAEPYPRTV